jgi:hypothetical protein
MRTVRFTPTSRGVDCGWGVTGGQSKRRGESRGKPSTPAEVRHALRPQGLRAPRPPAPPTRQPSPRGAGMVSWGWHGAGAAEVLGAQRRTALAQHPDMLQAQPCPCPTTPALLRHTLSPPPPASLPSDALSAPVAIAPLSTLAGDCCARCRLPADLRRGDGQRGGAAQSRGADSEAGIRPEGAASARAGARS